MLFRALVNRLLKRGKVHKVAILDLEGNIQMRSEDLELSERDIKTILGTINAGENAKGLISLMKIPLADTIFTCMFQSFHDDNYGPLVGRADKMMFAAVKTSKNIILGFSDLESPGSCIYEISEMGRALELRSR